MVKLDYTVSWISFHFSNSVVPRQARKPPLFLLAASQIVLDFCLELNCQPVFYRVPLIFGNHMVLLECVRYESREIGTASLTVSKFQSFQMIFQAFKPLIQNLIFPQGLSSFDVLGDTKVMRQMQRIRERLPTTCKQRQSFEEGPCSYIPPFLCVTILPFQLCPQPALFPPTKNTTYPIVVM